MPTSEALLVALEHGPLARFADWPNPLVPTVASGVYTVWDDSQLIYAGMAGRVLAAEDIARRRAAPGPRTGLWDRLNSHASGRRSGDQFCVYVCDRFVLRGLTQEQIGRIAAGALSLDRLTRDYIRQRLAYRFVETPDGRTAADLERAVQRGALQAGRPFLNPL